MKRRDLLKLPFGSFIGSSLLPPIPSLPPPKKDPDLEYIANRLGFKAAIKIDKITRDCLK